MAFDLDLHSLQNILFYRPLTARFLEIVVAVRKSLQQGMDLFLHPVFTMLARNLGMREF